MPTDGLTISEWSKQMSKRESTIRLNEEENYINSLAPYLKVFRSLVPQDYLFIDKTLQSTHQSSIVSVTESFFRQSTAAEQKNKTKVAGSETLFSGNTSDPECDRLTNINLNIPADQLDDFIQGLEAELCESEQKKIKIEPL